MGTDRPIIGLNTTFEMDAEGGFSATRPKYWKAVLEASGLPFLLPQLTSESDLNAALDRLDGVVMIGGYDIAGDAFGEETPPTVIEMESARYDADTALLQACIDRQKPTLAICLGFQELNVLLGGTLYQDLLFDGPETDVRHYSKNGTTPFHDIEILPDTMLAKAMGVSGTTSVNSVHHQAVAKIGKGLRTSAAAPDGIVEAVEMEGHPFLVGVQWHPEMMTDFEPQRALFRSLVEHAASHSSSPPL